MAGRELYQLQAGTGLTNRPMTEGTLSPAEKFITFINNAPTPFHAVREGIKKLESSGFTRLKESEDWGVAIRPGGKYFVTRHDSAIIAFVTPEEPVEKPVGFSIVGAHTDSPCFKVRPVSKTSSQGYVQVAVEKYGGILLPTWIDRDLSLAGRVIYEGENGYDSALIHIRKPILRIPSLAIHLGRGQNDNFAYNPETEMQPILGLINEYLNEDVSGSGDALDVTRLHSRTLLEQISQALAKETGKQVNLNDIHDFELHLIDTQPSVIGGANDEFIFSGRLDNLFSSFSALEALSHVDSVSERVALIALWDHEEIGSVSTHGAQSNFIDAVLERVSIAISGKSSASSPTEIIQQSIAKSFQISSDMGHAVHPSFPQKHHVNFRPHMNQGPAIKTNASQRYASTSQTTFVLRQVAARAGVPLQEYEVRNDMACGSTIGPLTSQKGLRTVDIGCAQLSMHSIRETAGAQDVGYLVALFKHFFTALHQVDQVDI